MNIARFLEHWQLTENPFRAEEARHDGVRSRMNAAISAHPDFEKILGDLSRPATSIVFGEKGSGKTAIRLHLAERVEAYNKEHPDARVLFVPYDDLNPFLDAMHEHAAGRGKNGETAKSKDVLASLEKIELVDHMDAMAGTMVPKVFEGIDGLEIIPLYFENSSGEFVHEPNPLVPSNLVDLQAKVTEEGADFGICFDGDADRLIVVDEKGGIVGCDILTALLAPHFLKQKPGAAVVYDLRSSKALEEAIRAAGGEPVRSRVGHVFMKAALAEKGGIFGGELSGHFYH